jgi:hypothetical protein
MTKLKIVGKAPERGPMTGQDMKVIVVVDGAEHLLPAMAVTVVCDGRKSFVTATVDLLVSEVDIEGLTEFTVVAGHPRAGPGTVSRDDFIDLVRLLVIVALFAALGYVLRNIP